MFGSSCGTPGAAIATCSLPRWRSCAARRAFPPGWRPDLRRATRRVDGSFNLRGEDKHAWTEVYFPQTAGWPSMRRQGPSPTAPCRVSRAEIMEAGLRCCAACISARGWELVALLLAVIFLIVCYVLKTEVYDRWRARRRPSARARRRRSRAPHCAWRSVRPPAARPCPARPAAPPVGNARRVRCSSRAAAGRAGTGIRNGPVAAPGSRALRTPSPAPATAGPRSIPTATGRRKSPGSRSAARQDAVAAAVAADQGVSE